MVAFLDVAMGRFSEMGNIALNSFFTIRVARPSKLRYARWVVFRCTIRIIARRWFVFPDVLGVDLRKWVILQLMLFAL